MRLQEVVGKGRSTAKTRHERKADSAVRIQSDAIAEHIIDFPKNQIRFNIGNPPRGLTNEEYMERVGTRALLALSMLGVAEGRVAYDHEASIQSTDELEAISHDQPLPRGAAGVRVVFSRMVAV